MFLRQLSIISLTIAICQIASLDHVPQHQKPKPASGPPLAVVWRRIETLRPDPANPRSHSTKQIRQLTRSIGAFGFNVPILVDRTLRIIAGHGRLLAAQELGWREVPTILLAI